MLLLHLCVSNLVLVFFAHSFFIFYLKVLNADGQLFSYSMINLPNFLN